MKNNRSIDLVFACCLFEIAFLCWNIDEMHSNLLKRFPILYFNCTPHRHQQTYKNVLKIYRKMGWNERKIVKNCHFGFVVALGFESNIGMHPKYNERK